MRVLNKTGSALMLSFIMGLFFSCNKYLAFTPGELRFAKPFAKDQEHVFKSESGQLDTIIFYTAILDTMKFRNIEQGFYDDKRLKVGYALRTGSYHKLSTNLLKKEPQNFIQFSKARNSYETKQISFLGMVFSDDYMNKIVDKQTDSILFIEENAQYNVVNINEGIKSFTFDFTQGILAYTDLHGIKWTRVD